jgi:hypothetical protein
VSYEYIRVQKINAPLSLRLERMKEEGTQMQRVGLAMKIFNKQKRTGWPRSEG